MSGGHFNHIQSTITNPIEEIQEIIDNNGQTRIDDWGCDVSRDYSDETITKFCETIKALHRASIMLNRVDYLLSGDDGEESFNRRWDEELNEQ